MALPWLIGAAVIGAGSYIAKKLREEEEEREREERRERRREQEAQERAEQTRRAKALEEKKNAKLKEFMALGEVHAEDFKQLLDGLIVVRYTKSPVFFAKFYDASDVAGAIDPGACIRVREISNPFVIANKMDCLDQQTKDNLTNFEAMYQVELRPTLFFIESLEKFNYAEKTLSDISSLRQRLEHQRNKLTID